MARKPTSRSEDLSGRPKIKKRLLDVFTEVEKGFENERERADKILDYWDVFECVLGPRQFYNGNSRLFVPIVRGAIRARRTRFINQMFPQSGRYVEVTSTDGDLPLEMVALIEHYIRDSRIRTQVMPALLVNGDVEGQYNAYVHWDRIERFVASKDTQPVKMGGVDVPEAGEIEVIVEEKIEEAGPAMEVLHDADVLVWPPTVDTITQALEAGGHVTIVRRWTKGTIAKLKDEGEILEDEAEMLMQAMSKVDDQRKDTRKALAKIAGIKVEDGQKIAVVFETWVKLKVDGKLRICKAYFGGDYGGLTHILGCKLNPYWCDRVPLLSAPVEKQAGVFKGESLIRPGVMDLQVYANDAINMSADGLPFHSIPLLTVDPEKVARWENLVIDVGAVWPIGQDGAKVLQFPDVTPQALQVVSACKAQIFESLGVNPSMLPQQTGKPGSKRNQAEVALEQQVDLLTTADAVTNIEQEILTPYVQRALDYDHQFREKDIRVKMFGPMGQRANMQLVPPIQRHTRYTMVWLGVEAARDAARIQQQISFFGVLMKLPKELYQGYRLNGIPMLTRAVENIFGPSLGSQIFENVGELYAVSPEDENRMLAQGFVVRTSPLDKDPQHMQVHMALLQSLDAASIPARMARAHIAMHQQQMQMKQQAMMAQMIQAQPMGGGGQRRIRGPQPGAQPGLPRPARQPPGAIARDRMPAAGALAPPRKT